VYGLVYCNNQQYSLSSALQNCIACVLNSKHTLAAMQTQDTLLAAAPLETQSMARLWADPETRGLLLGLLGITMFALTPAMTRLAVGTSTAPLMTGMLFAVPLLGESLDAVSIGFALAVLATAIAGRRMPTPRPNAAS
jgi:hypothetical protein